MNRTLPLLLATFITISSAAHAQRGGPGRGAPQGQGSVSGTVIDTATGEPLPGATVALRNAADSSLVTGDIAAKDGAFSIDGVQPGRYYARVSFVGYVTRLVDVTVTAAEPKVALGNVGLGADMALGRDVSITAKREFMTQAIDRTIYRSADLAVASGGTASDILKNIPSIEVDANGRVSLRGNQNVVIQINGRPTMMSGDALAAFLRSLPASAVERIEVIPNPSAKYDPDGMIGIINIVLKQQSDRGLNGGVNGAIGSNFFDSYGNAGGNIGYGAGPLNAMLNYGFEYNNYRNSGTYYRENRLPVAVPFLEQTNGSTWRGKAHSLNGNVDYAIDPANILSLTGFANITDAESRGLAVYDELDSAHRLARRFQRTNHGTGDYLMMDYRLAYRRIFEQGKHELSAEARLSGNNNIDEDTYIANDLATDGGAGIGAEEQQQVNADMRTRQSSAQLDYSKAFESGVQIEAGYKWSFERLKSNQSSAVVEASGSTFLPNVEFSNAILYDRTIHATYANVGDDFGTFGVQAGVRLEQALTTFDLTTTGESFRNDYFSIFPSAFISWRPTEATQVKLSYSKRINRPNIWMLNPAVSQEDQLFHRTGNPHLRPEYTHAMQLTLSAYAENASLTINPFFSRATDVMRRIPTIDTNGITTVRLQNLSTNDSWGTEMVGTLRIGAWFNGMLSGGIFHYVTDAGDVGNSFNNDALGWNVRATTNFAIIDGLDLQVAASYNAPMEIEGGKVEGSSETELALTQKLFEDRGRLGLRLSDPFKTQRWGVVRTAEEFYQELHSRWNSRNVVLSFSYVFGTPDRNRRPNDGPRQSGPMMEG